MALAGGFLPRQLRGVQCNAGLGDFKIGDRASGELAFQQTDDIALRRFLPGQQRFGFARGVKIEQCGADAAAGLPRGRNKIPARGFGKMLRLGDAFAAFAGGFDRDVPRHAKNPRWRRGGVVGGRETNGWIRDVRPR